MRHPVGRGERQGARDRPPVHGLDDALRQQLRARRFTLQRTGCKGGDAAYEKAIGKYPAFNYSKAIFNAKANWKINPTGDRLALWNRRGPRSSPHQLPEISEMQAQGTRRG